MQLFTLNWIPVISADVSDESLDVLELGFIEHTLLNSGQHRLDGGRIWEHGAIVRYPLRRAGTVECETLTLKAPDGVEFVPLKFEDECEAARSDSAGGARGGTFEHKPEKFFSIEDRSKVYLAENTNKEKSAAGSAEAGGAGDAQHVRLQPAIIDACGLMTPGELFVQTSTRWKNDKEGPFRRFAIPVPGGKRECPNWADYISTRQHSYYLKVSMIGQPGKIARAHSMFFITSIVALAFVLLILLFGSHANGSRYTDFGSANTLLMGLCIVVPLMALLFSNLQEEIPYYRHLFIKEPQKWVKAGAIVDALAFACIVVAALLPDVVALRWVSLFIFSAAICMMAWFLVLDRRWRRCCDSRDGKNRRWLRDHDSMTGLRGIEIERISLPLQ